MKRRVERSPATMGRATFRSEISPLRFAAVEMTEGAWQRSGQFAPGNDCMLPAGIVISSGGERAGMVVKTLGSIETLSREISCHHGACHISA